jgi:hypothetical protein
MQLPRPHSFGSKRNINALKARQMALKWESCPDESFKCMWGSLFVQQRMQ